MFEINAPADAAQPAGAEGAAAVQSVPRAADFLALTQAQNESDPEVELVLPGIPAAALPAGLPLTIPAGRILQEGDEDAVLCRQADWCMAENDVLAYLNSLPENSVDLIFSSPPYDSKARRYGTGKNLKGQEWVDWMVEVFLASLRVCRGLVAYVIDGSTRDFRWSCTPVLLMADLHRRGIHLRKPVSYVRNGIPGSGGHDWLKNNWEMIVCATHGGALPWSDNTACGQPPLYKRSGPFSNRRPNGARNHRAYTPPALANPGNVIFCKVGGNQMGSALAHDNEAPFPEALAERFVRSFCPPDGFCCDPFSGSGTTGVVALRFGRRFLGCDMRAVQVELTRRRIAELHLAAQPESAPAPSAAETSAEASATMAALPPASVRTRRSAGSEQALKESLAAAPGQAPGQVPCQDGSVVLPAHSCNLAALSVELMDLTGCAEAPCTVGAEVAENAGLPPQEDEYGTMLAADCAGFGGMLDSASNQLDSSPSGSLSYETEPLDGSLSCPAPA